MKKVILVTTVFLSAVFFCACEDEKLKGISGITIENFPKLDGSTSNEPLMRIIACRLLGVEYEWVNGMGVSTVRSKNYYIENLELVKTSQTHNAILNVIDGTAEVVLSARKMSSEEKQYADGKGVTLIETPIALDAFIFIVNAKNPVNSLTHNEIIGIYTGQYTHWKQVGGNDSVMHPYVRNQNSGSQELMESLVMQGTPIADFAVDYEPTVYGMLPVYHQLRLDENGICYIVYYYHDKMIENEAKEHIKKLAINGIAPNSETIKNGKYPYVEPVYAVIRSDLDRNSMAYKLYEWLQTKDGKKVIKESGYILK